MEASTAAPADTGAEQEQGQEAAPEQSTEPTNAELQEQMQAIAQKLEGSGSEEPAPVADLGSALAPEEDGEEYDEGDLEDFDPYAQELPPELAQVTERLDAHEQYLIGQQEQARMSGLKELGVKYPELQDQKMVDRVAQALDELAADTQSPELAQRPTPRLVEQIYKSLKADEESASETPAEEAVSQGASLETGAGPGNQGGDVSVEDQIGDAIVASGTPKSAFT